MIILLEKLTEKLTKKNAPVLRYLQEGISRDSIKEKAKELGLIFPEELFELYGWRNGTKKEKTKLGLLWLFPGAIFFSLETAIEIYIARANRDKYWKQKMFPVFGDGGGDFYLLNLDTKSPSYGQIFLYFLGDPDFDIVISFYDSLESGLMTELECYNENVYYFIYDDENDLMPESDEVGLRRIAKELNPNSKYWKLD